MMNPGDSNFVICGQVLTGRLEVLEFFLKGRFRQVFIIGLNSVFAKLNAARITIFTADKKSYEKKIFNLLISKDSPFKGIFFILAYIIYVIHIFLAIFKFRQIQKKLIFIGIGFYPSLIGIILKKLGLIEKVIYYSIDYFPPTSRTFLCKVFFWADKFCVRHSDLVWLITPQIGQARQRFSQVTTAQYPHLIVPLCFDDRLLRSRPAYEVERWSILFVGTSGYFHGLHLLVQAMPDLIRILPGVKIKIIGPGPWDKIQKEIAQMGLSGYFDFIGFIEDETQLADTISRCALGLALYVPEPGNPTYYADPGKLKLYAFASVPAVLSKIPPVWKEIESCGAGRPIEFNTGSLIEAIVDILSDEGRWNSFRANAFVFAKRYTSQEIIGPALESSLKIFNYC